MKNVQGSGIVRFFHRKHQCYVVGEGSFAGKYSSLPDLEDSSDSFESSLTDILKMKSSTQRVTYPREGKFEVSVDIEPTEQDIAPIPSPYFDSSLTSGADIPLDESEVRLKSPDPQARASMLTISDDAVVLDDGKDVSSINSR